MAYSFSPQKTPEVFMDNISYAKADGTETNLKVPYVIIPAGTLLFRGIQLPNPRKGEDPRLFVRDWLGYPKGSRFCMTPTQNTFFYTSPFVPFGAHTVGEWFNAVLVCQTVKTMKLMCMISPSKWTRGGELKKFDGDAPIQRCDRFDYTCLEGASPAQKAKEKELKAWDNCIRPQFAQSNDVAGWIAIADYDSLDNFKEGLHGKETTMGKYIIDLERRMPGKGAELLTSTYKDDSGHRGFPEVVLHPWYPHPGTENQYTEATTEEDAADAIAEMSDKFSYLPIACITERGIVEAFTGDFKASDLPMYATVAAPGEITRTAIDKLQDEYIKKLQTTGTMIEGIGKAKLLFDGRTGFYVLDQFIDRDLKFLGNTMEGFPNGECLMPLNDEDAQKDVIDYKIRYRSYFKDQLFKREVLLTGMAADRSFVFERPPLFYQQFKELGIRFPPQYIPYVEMATSVFQTDKAKKLGITEKPQEAIDAEARAQEALKRIAAAKTARGRGTGTGTARGTATGRGRGASVATGAPAAVGATSVRGRGRGRGMRGGRFCTTRRNKQKKQLESNFAVFQEGGADLDAYLKDYVGPTMKRMWANFLQQQQR